MPLPLLLLGGTVLAAVYGAKKGLDAISDFDDAEEINEDAREIYEDAQHSLDERRKKTQKALKSLGREKILLYKDTLPSFVETFSKIKDVDYYEEGDILDEKLPVVSIHDFQAIREVVLSMEEVTPGAVAASTLAGLAAYGSAGVVSGTVIATLAWFGGSSTAVGGMSMALASGGLLGGIIAPPVLLVGGLMMASEAEEAKENALSNLHKAEEHVKAMKRAENAAHKIGHKAAEVRNVLKQLQHYLCRDLEALKHLLSIHTDYRTYNGSERELVHRTASLAVTTKNLAETPLLTENGSITDAIRQELKKAKRSL